MSTPSDLLRFLADARAEYYRGPEPETAADIDRMNSSDLIVWVQTQTARALAEYLDNPDDAWGWIPTWKQHEWDALIEENQV